RNTVDNAIGAYILRTIVQNRHPRLNPGTDHKRFEFEKLGSQFLGNANHRWNDTGGDYRMNLIAPEALGENELRNDHSVFISRSFRHGQQTPVGDQVFALVETQDDVAIADIDREKHLLAIQSSRGITSPATTR